MDNHSIMTTIVSKLPWYLVDIMISKFLNFVMDNHYKFRNGSYYVEKSSKWVIFHSRRFEYRMVFDDKINCSWSFLRRFSSNQQINPVTTQIIILDDLIWSPCLIQQNLRVNPKISRSSRAPWTASRCASLRTVKHGGGMLHMCVYIQVYINIIN